MAHSRAYSTAWECVRTIGYDSFSEPVNPQAFTSGRAGR
jgi:hypothetical protein